MIGTVVLGFHCSVWADPGEAFQIERTVAHQGFDGRMCWVHARAGVVASSEGSEHVIMTMQKLLLSGSDVFYELHQMTTRDGGKTWSSPQPITGFKRQVVSSDPNAKLPTGAAIAPHLLKPGDETTVCDFAPQWHAETSTLLGIGQTVWYRNNRVMHPRPRGIAYAVYEPDQASWSDWGVVDLPSVPRFQDAGSGSVQRVDLANGDVLLPFYFKEPNQRQYSVAVCRCRFDGTQLQYQQHGNEMTVPIKRGLYEPSLTRFAGRFYLTLRNDDHGYVCTSDDGLHFSTPKRWTFDDGQDLGNYNTQQHWLQLDGRLYLVYTRRGADNDHVFRHRAPLFMAAVDPGQVHVIRNSERVLVPEHGARLGNFGVTAISPTQAWVTVTEWMQPKGVEKYGSDNRVFVVKLRANES